MTGVRAFLRPGPRGALAAVVAALAALNAALLLWPSADPKASVAADWTPPAAGLPAVVADPRLDQSRLPETVERPLFTASRSVAPPRTATRRAAAPEPEPVRRPPPRAELRGVIVADAPLALVVRPGTDGGDWIGIDSTLDGWTVSAIEADGITLKDGDREIRLLLDPDRPRR